MRDRRDGLTQLNLLVTIACLVALLLLVLGGIKLYRRSAGTGGGHSEYGVRTRSSCRAGRWKEPSVRRTSAHG